MATNIGCVDVIGTTLDTSCIRITQNMRTRYIPARKPDKQAIRAVSMPYPLNLAKGRTIAASPNCISPTRTMNALGFGTNLWMRILSSADTTAKARALPRARNTQLIDATVVR